MIRSSSSVREPVVITERPAEAVMYDAPPSPVAAEPAIVTTTVEPIRYEPAPVFYEPPARYEPILAPPVVEPPSASIAIEPPSFRTIEPPPYREEVTMPIDARYEPIIMPETTDTRVVVGSIKDQATLSLEREIVPVEPPPPPASRLYGERVYIDTQATEEPKEAAVKAEILASMSTSRYEPVIDFPPTAGGVPIVGTQAGGVVDVPGPVGPTNLVTVPPEIMAVVKQAFMDAEVALAVIKMKANQLTPAQNTVVKEFKWEVGSFELEVKTFNAANDTVRATINVQSWIPKAQSISKNASNVVAVLQGTASSGTPWLLIGAVGLGLLLLLKKGS